MAGRISGPRTIVARVSTDPLPHGDAPIARRGFLRVAGATVVVGLAGACSKSATQRKPLPSSSAVPTSAAGSSAAPTTTTTPPPSPTGPPDWTALGKGLDGPLLLPDDSGYAAAHQLFNPRFDGLKPQAVAQCASADDVAECVRFAGRYGIPLAPRSGGHSYAGWSAGPGLVIDVRKLAAITGDGRATATVGAGARLVDVYQTLADKGVGIPAGSCPTVGIAGLTLGGGLGVLDRAWGLACDNVVSLQIVTADGEIRTVDAKHDPDLFWACRGGGGGTFGAVTSLQFKTRPAPPVATWYLQWSWSQAAAVLAGWQRWAPSSPDEIWSTVHLSSASSNSLPVVAIAGSYVGHTGDLPGIFAGLIAAIGSDPISNSSEDHSYAEAMLFEAGCGDKTYEQCHLTPAGTVARQAYAASSDIVNRPLSNNGVGALVSAVHKVHDSSPIPDISIALDAAGGAVNRVAPTATAYVHRKSICSIQYIANWYDSTSSSAVQSAAAWPHAVRTSMQPYVSGEAYQNYCDPQITDWQRAYFGANYARLAKIKSRYDPHNLFAHYQGVLPG